MQIDFHHAVTYTIARLAGFEHKDADTIAYCAQYVDDAINSGTIFFTSGEMYNRIGSAHRMLDYRNFQELANHHVWIPFHFLPGNDGKDATANKDGKFLDKIICRPNSKVALDMVQSCIDARSKPYALHRLGITMHVYADTWAHQGFAGVNHPVNQVHEVADFDGRPDSGFELRMKEFFSDVFDAVGSRFVSETLPLGHGAVLSYPDRPYLRWSYVDCNGKRVERDNPKDFIEAAENMYKVLLSFRNGTALQTAPAMPQQDRSRIAERLAGFEDDDGETRHRRWLRDIAGGAFSFGKVELLYQPKGQDSWKFDAVGARHGMGGERELYQYQPNFLRSNWKHFHDALMAHRFAVLHEILPKYNICAA
jgi:hypothetical protein